MKRLVYHFASVVEPVVTLDFSLNVIIDSTFRLDRF